MKITIHIIVNISFYTVVEKMYKINKITLKKKKKQQSVKHPRIKNQKENWELRKGF